MTGAEDISRERARQLAEEGYSLGGDLGRAQELMSAAMSYITSAHVASEALAEGHSQEVIQEVNAMGPPPDWPWASRYWKPTTAIRDLTKAGALIAAAIDALAPPIVMSPVQQQAFLPHSRACGARMHDHGTACHENCPTCHGQQSPAQQERISQLADEAMKAWQAEVPRMTQSLPNMQQNPSPDIMPPRPVKDSPQS